MTQTFPLKIVGDSGERHKPSPLGTRDDWKLIVRVGKTIIKEYSIDDLLRLESTPYGAETGIKCVSSGGIIHGRGKNSVTFGGVRLSSLFEDLHLKDELGPVGRAIFSEGEFKAKIRGTLFKGCTFAGVNLQGCNFSLSRFPNTTFSEKGENPADLTECDLEGANLQSAHLQEVSMQGAWLSNAVFTQDFKATTTDRVRGLNVKRAHDLDEKTRAWLYDNGASV
jgi:hypothetical protein